MFVSKSKKITLALALMITFLCLVNFSIISETKEVTSVSTSRDPFSVGSGDELNALPPAKRTATQPPAQPLHKEDAPIVPPPRDPQEQIDPFYPPKPLKEVPLMPGQAAKVDRNPVQPEAAAPTQMAPMGMVEPGKMPPPMADPPQAAPPAKVAPSIQGEVKLVPDAIVNLPSPAEELQEEGHEVSPRAVMMRMNGQLVDPLPKKKTASELTDRRVFVYSMPRSGSSFTGDLFQETKDTVYIFEPWNVYSSFKGILDGCGESPASLDKRKISQYLQEIYTCHFGPINKTQTSWWMNIHWTSLPLRQACVPGQPPSKMVAVKDIKSFWSYNLEYLKSSLGPGMRFIWLVRDVRGWVSSFLYKPKNGQEYMYQTWKYYLTDFYRNFYSTCSQAKLDELQLPQEVLDLLPKYKRYLATTREQPHLRLASLWTIETLIQYHQLNKHLPNEHFYLNYEAMSKDPLGIATEIMKFVGFEDLPPETRGFIINSTTKDVPDRYKTQRNSTAMEDIWKQRLTICQIKQIEVLAQPVFRILGYRNYTGANVVVPDNCKLDFLENPPPLITSSYQQPHSSKISQQQAQKSNNQRLTQQSLQQQRDGFQAAPMSVATGRSLAATQRKR